VRVLAAVAIVGLLGPPAFAIDEAPETAATRTVAPIRVDGVLDEDEWRRAAAVGPLLQREPQQGVTASEATDVRVLYDADHLYVGISCHQADSRSIVSTQLARDADLSVDDYVLVVLDPFLDHRNGFFFQVNPAGARADGQISNNSESLTFDWDGIWEARTRVSAEGWTAEIALPFKTLRFRPGQAVWGLNVERQIKRLQEKDRWAAALRDVWISNLSKAGRLSGLEAAQQGRGLDIRPYVSGGEEDSQGRWKAGLDVVKNLAPNLNASLTVNTDFAETEVDARQVNLTRFPLFFPEKRGFFLEGAGVYDTAGQNADLIPFFTRRVGLLGDQQVPLLGGVKISGRLSNWNVGVLDVETRKTENATYGTVDRQNLLALRVSRNLLEQSWVGAIATRGDPTGAGDDTLVGADVRLATSRFRGGKNLSLDLYAFRTDGGALAKSGHALGFRLDFPNDSWDVVLRGKHIDEQFDAALGFVPRVGIRKLELGVAFQPRPERFGIRQLFFELRPSLITNLDNRIDNWSVFAAPFNCRTESGEHLELNFVPQFERLEAGFEIQPGIVVPPGTYQWTRFGAEINTATKRPWVVDAALSWGGFYDGKLRTLEAGFTLKLNTHLSASLKTEHNEASLPQGEFATRIYSIRADYNFSADLAWSNLVQYDSESRTLGFQGRVRWTIRPGHDLFVVANRGWLRRIEDGRYIPSFDRATAKLQYTFRL